MQVLDAVMAEAISAVFEEYVDKHGLEEIAELFDTERAEEPEPV